MRGFAYIGYNGHVEYYHHKRYTQTETNVGLPSAFDENLGSCPRPVSND